MQKIASQDTAKSVLNVASLLVALGFNLQLIGSELYCKGKLASLHPHQVDKIKEAFIKNKHPRFTKSVL